MKSWEIFVIAFYGFMGNVTMKSILNCFIENRNFFVKILFSVKRFDSEVKTCRIFCQSIVWFIADVVMENI